MTLFSEFYLICCVNKSMNFKNWLLSEDIWQGNTATVYHRTKSVKDVSGVLTSDYKTGTGCMYGCGLYTTFAIESQFSNYMQTYGKALIKFKVTGLDKYLIFQLSVAKQIHGKDYKISDQFKKLGLLNKVNEIKLKEYDERQEKEKYSSVLAKEFYDENSWIVNSVKGIIYYGKNDGYCLIKYPTIQDGTITMWGYAVADVDNQQKMGELRNNIGWIKSVGVLGTPIKTAYKAPNKMKEKFAFGDNNNIQNIINIFLTSKNLERTAQKFASELDKFSDENILSLLKSTTNKDQMVEVIIKYKKELTDSNVSYLIIEANDKDKTAELIIKKKPELSDQNVRDFLVTATDKDKTAEIIINKILKLSDNNVENLLRKAKDKDKIAQIIIKKKPELSDYNVAELLNAATNKDAIGYLIIEKKPKLTSNNVASLISYATNKYQMAYFIIEKKKELADDDFANLLVYADDKKQEIAELIIEKKPELSHSNIYSLVYHATNKDKMAKLIIEKKPDLSDTNVAQLLQAATNKNAVAELIIENKPDLSNINVSQLLRYATDKDKIAELLGTDNINKLSDKNIYSLLDSSTDRREQIAKIIIKYKSELSGDDVGYLTSNLKDNTEILELILNNLRQSKYPVHDKAIGWIFDRSKDKDTVINDMIKILQEKNQEISTYSFEKFIQHATDKLKMAMTLIKIKKQLSLEEASILIRNAKDRNEMVKLIDKPYSFLKSLTSWDAFRYKKLPEVQDMINQELKRRKRSRFSSDFD